MSDRPLLRVFVRGGVISPADMLRTLDASEAAGSAHVLFSSRQDILFPAGERPGRAEDILSEAGLDFVRTSLAQLNRPLQPRNIVSSYAAVNVMETTWWLKEAVYQNTLANFEGQPLLKVNVVDPVQSLIPLFGGHLHFIASKTERYWHLYMRADDHSERIERWPGLLHGDDLARVTRHIEKRLVSSPGTPLPRLMDDMREELAKGDPGDSDEIKLPNPLFPYYEGLNAMLSNQYWLGLYWRNNRFDIPFLRAACHLCQDTRVGKISLTPWKSFIIKGIHAEDRIRWEKLMGAFGINMRHSSLELNWHIPVLDDEALELKNDLVRELTMEDISTHGLTFTVKSSDPAPLFTSVVVERERADAGLPPRYTIRHARDFDPNRSEYVEFARGVRREALGTRLIELSKRYSNQLDVERASVNGAASASAPPELASSRRCPDCLTVYDAAYGDPDMGVPPGVSFEHLPDDYVCPVCAAEKARFLPLATL